MNTFTEILRRPILPEGLGLVEANWTKTGKKGLVDDAFLGDV